MNKNLQSFETFVEQVISEQKKCLEAVVFLNYDSSLEEICLEGIELLEKIKSVSNSGNLKLHYQNYFKSIIDGVLFAIKDINFDEYSLEEADEIIKGHYLNKLSEHSHGIVDSVNTLKFNIDFFEKVGYLNSDVVIVGVNGSGKTSMSIEFKQYLHNGIVISAQKLLIVPEFKSIANPNETALKLSQAQSHIKTSIGTGDVYTLQNEFSILLNNLLANHNKLANEYREEAVRLTKSGSIPKEPVKTTLELVFEIWAELVEHRLLECSDGMNVIVKYRDNTTYPASKLSDGEKVIFYMISQVLQAPRDGFIVIDEPEMFLHKTILKKLWNRLETHRDDCVFIYLTHDLDFATSRTRAKKIWIKSNTDFGKRMIEPIPTDEIPEALLLEILGSRKNILFCEGEKGSLDEQVYSLLFPDMTVMPVGSCFSVINQTRAFNKLQNVNTTALGLIDADHHDGDRLHKLVVDRIYSFNVAEVENLFLAKEFLKIVGSQFLCNDSIIQNIIDDIIERFEEFKELQVSNYISAKINYYFTDSDVTKGNTKEKLLTHYNHFIKKIDIEKWYEERMSIVEEMILARNYDQIISCFNNKSLKGVAGKHLKINDYTNKCIKLLSINEDARDAILNYFPRELRCLAVTS